MGYPSPFWRVDSRFRRLFGHQPQSARPSLANGRQGSRWHASCLRKFLLMAAARRTPAQRAGATAARGASWMSLLAAATLGVSGVDHLRARISAGDHVGDGDLRLIVQAYSKTEVATGELPERHAQPLASIQRSITAEELREGINVSFLQFPTDGAGGGESVVVAWVEHGAPDLDLDALEARPAKSAFYGTALEHDGEIVLRRGVG